MASDNNITTETKLLSLEKFIHKISIKKYLNIIYDLFAATLSNSRQIQKEIWKKTLEFKSQMGVYRETYVKDESFLLIVGRDKHICNNTIELNHLHSDEDFLIQSIFIYQNILNSINHPIILQALYIYILNIIRSFKTIKKTVNVIQYILKLYTYEGSNSLLDIYTKPTHNITRFCIHILTGENDTLFNFLNFEDTYNFFFIIL